MSAVMEQERGPLSPPRRRIGAAADSEVRAPMLPFDATLDDAFLRFHMDNPKVYERLVRKARAWRDAGHSHGSIKMFWESLRFDYGLEIGARGRFKLNNNHHSRYARLIMEREHDLAGFFETRELHEGKS